MKIIFYAFRPLYHTGAKMHWFGSLLSGSKAVLLRGIKPEWILKTVSEEKITIVWLSSSLGRRISWISLKKAMLSLKIMIFPGGG